MELTEENLNGKTYNRWKIIKFSHKVGYHKYFICECLDCNKKKPVAIQNIIRGVSKSCGCKSKIETAYNINKKYNKYEIDNDVVYVNLNNSDENIMICDLEDWNKQKDCYWIKNRGGYATSCKNHKTIIFHRIIMGTNDSKIQVDHINGNTLDNRKQNLRICSNQENSFNKNKNSNNSSGYKGVYFDKERNKWRSAIQFNGKSIKSPKRYDTPEEAYEWYVQKSNELFGDFSVFKSRK
jgi:hypothetical protein